MYRGSTQCTLWSAVINILSPLNASLFCFFPDSDEEPVRKSKKSPKEKQKATKLDAPAKKDPVQYVSETGDGLPPQKIMIDAPAQW